MVVTYDHVCEESWSQFYFNQINSADAKPLAKYNSPDADFTLGTIQPDQDDQKVLTGWFSHEGLHLAPGVQNAMSNMMLIEKGSSKRISVVNKPLPKSLIDRVCLIELFNLT